jgi:hypothetical protein
MIKVKIKETNSNPSILHGNGKASRLPNGVYNNLKSKFLNTQTPIQDKNDNVTIVTWKGGKYANQETILETCMRYYDHPIVILDWPENKHFWEGSKFKVTGTLDAIKQGLVTTEYVMWFDCSDVILLESPSDILTNYQKHFEDYDLVFCAERNHYPKSDRMTAVSTDIISQYDKIYEYDNKSSPSTFKYLNSGCLVGKTSKLQEFLKEATIGLDEDINDTVMCRIAQYNMRDSVTVDKECKLFACLYDVGPEDVEIESHE